MMSPVFVEKFALPALDWAAALLQAFRHLAQGTLCADPVPACAADSE
jgi:hypothetical protein